jgi:hypothetical protein
MNNTVRLAGLRDWGWMFLFIATVSPSILSYKPLALDWDGAFYAHRAVCMNREFYHFNVKGMANCLAATHKGPAIDLAGLPWGPAGSTESGIGLALVGLAMMNFALAWATYWVALTSGIAPWCLALSGAAIGLAPVVQESGGALMTDALVAWCSTLALMLGALEYRTSETRPWPSFWRGALWGSVMMIGSLAKMTFGLFGLATLPILIYARWRRSGRRALAFTAIGAITFSLPGLLVWFLCGQAMVEFARLAFSEVAALWSIPGMGPGDYIWRFFSGLHFAIIPLTILLICFSRRIFSEKVRLVPIGIIATYLLIAAVGQNREPRYTVTIAVTLPLALSWNSLRDRDPRRLGESHFLGIMLVALMLAIPMVARPQLTPVRHVEELLADLSHGKPTTIVLATDGPDENIEVLQLARQLGGDALRPLYLDTLVYDAINKRTLEDGYRRMAAANYVLFLKSAMVPGPDWTRTWAASYRTYAEKIGVLLASPSSREFEVFQIKRQ